MNSLIQKYELILKTFRDISISDDFYFKPIKPKLSDLELITLNIAAESSGIDSEYQLFRELRLSRLNGLIERSVYNRRRRKLFPYMEKLRTKLAAKLTGNQKYFLVDSMPLEICKNGRMTRSKICKEQQGAFPNQGFCASQNARYYGYKLHAVCSVDAVFDNFPLYGDMSNRIMSILRNYAVEQEIYSIDECFLRLDGFELFNLQDHGLRMKNEVYGATGVPISIGIAPTKALAKVANRIAKRYPKETQGVYMITTEAQRLKALKWLSVEDIWGIGRQHAKRLLSIKIKTALDFTLLDEKWLQKNMSIVGLRLQRDLKGMVTLDLEEPGKKKHIATTRSFDHNFFKFEELSERVATFAAACSEKLRKQETNCKSLTVFIITNRFREDDQQY